MPRSRRVVITGANVICPLGCNRNALWEALVEGRSGVKLLASVPPDHLPSKVGGEARDFTGDIEQFGPLEKTLKRSIKKGCKMMCREIQMGVAAAQLAMQDANLESGGYEPDRTGVVFGSDYIMTVPEEFTDGIRQCVDEQKEFHFEKWAENGLPKVDPLWLLKFLPNMPASHIAIYNDMRGPNNSLTLREASANLAIGEAFETIVRGSADRMIAGATGSRVHPLRTVHVMLQEELTDCDEPEKACRPFDKNRTGAVIGEGAAAVILEDLESARKRGATILGEIVAWGSSTVTGRDGVGRCDVAIKNVLIQALQSAGLQPGDIGHVHAHGLATRKCDAEDARGIHEVFADVAVPVTAAKSYFGNLGAGGGVVETIASVMAMNHGTLFPTLNYETPDEDCPVSVVTSTDHPAGDCFINLNVTPQGQASSLLVKRFDG